MCLLACVAWRFCPAGLKLLPLQSPRGFSALVRLYYLVRPTKIAMLRRLCTFITLEAIPIRALVRGGFQNAGLVCGKDQRNCNAWLSKLRIERWVNELPPQKKNILLLKPDTLFKMAVWWRSVDALRVTE